MNSSFLMSMYLWKHASLASDLTGQVIHDDIFARLVTFPDVIITGHQAFFTNTVMENIAHTTLKNIADFEIGQVTEGNLVRING